jgi:hypothetical protein
LDIGTGFKFLIFKSFAAKLATSMFVAGLSSEALSISELCFE